MSDTSDFTVASDSDSAPVLPDSVSGSTATPAAIPTMVHMADEAQDVLKAIRECIRAAYNLRLPPTAESPSLEKDDNKQAYEARAANGVVDILEHFDSIMQYMPREGFTETVGLLVDSMAEAAQILVAAIVKNPNMCIAEIDALINVVTLQLQFQAVQRARESLLPAQAQALGCGEVNDALFNIMDIVWYPHRKGFKAVADIHTSLLPKYARSCAAFHDSAPDMSGAYIGYAKTILSDLDSGESGSKKDGHGRALFEKLGLRTLCDWYASFWR